MSETPQPRDANWDTRIIFWRHRPPKPVMCNVANVAKKDIHKSKKYWQVRDEASNSETPSSEILLVLLKEWFKIENGAWDDITFPTFGFTSLHPTCGGAEVECTKFESVMVIVAYASALISENIDYAFGERTQIDERRKACARNMSTAAAAMKEALATLRSWKNNVDDLDVAETHDRFLDRTQKVLQIHHQRSHIHDGLRHLHDNDIVQKVREAPT